MLDDRQPDGRIDAKTDTEFIASADGRGGQSVMPKVDRGSHLQVRTRERVAVICFEDAGVLLEENALRSVGEQLHHLIEEDHTLLVLNFEGVRYMSSDMLGILASLQKKNAPRGGHLHLCGLDPLLLDMLQITHLDLSFDIYGDEAEALGGVEQGQDPGVEIGPVLVDRLQPVTEWSGPVRAVDRRAGRRGP